MKQSETRQKRVAMIASFLFAGVSLIIAAISIFSWANNGAPFIPSRLGSSPMVLVAVQIIAVSVLIYSSIGATISSYAGWMLLKSQETHFERHTKERVEKEAENVVPADVLTPDELKIMKILKSNNNSMTQKDLTQESELSKVKIHRVLKKLEAKKIISKYQYGMTNRIKLEKDIKE